MLIPCRITHGDTQEVVISLPSDTVFFEVLMDTFQALNTHLADVRKNFIGNLKELSKKRGVHHQLDS